MIRVTVGESTYLLTRRETNAMLRSLQGWLDARRDDLHEMEGTEEGFLIREDIVALEFLMHIFEPEPSDHLIEDDPQSDEAPESDWGAEDILRREG